MVVLEGKHLQHSLTVGEVPGTMYGMDSELFQTWFFNHFLELAPKRRPLLLLLDGHSSHFNPDMIKIAAKESIDIFCLPHSTHVSQPQDKICFSPLKQYWRQQCTQYLLKNPHRRLTKYCFSELFCKAWFQAMTPSNAAAGFRATGIFPFNRDAIKLPQKSERQDAGKSKTIEKGSIIFLPLFSPSRSQAEQRSTVTVQPSDSALEEFTEDREVSMSDSLVCLAHSSEDDEYAMSCTCLSSHQQSPYPATFTEEENERFQKRQDEGYDITTDLRYNLWLILQEGTEKSLGNAEPSTLKQKPKQAPSIFLSLELPLPPQPKPSGCARVLTSLECLWELEEKQRRKQEKEDMKEKRKKDREEKQREKERLAKEKQEKKEKKRKEKEAIEQRSACEAKKCGHPSATRWIQCDSCNG